MANEKDPLDSSFEDPQEVPDYKSSYVERLRQQITHHDIPQDALHDWLDVYFRNEAVPDNNIAWAAAVRNIAQYFSTAELAEGFAQAQWRAMTWGESRIVVKISTSVHETDIKDPVVDEHALLKRYFQQHRDLFEESELRARLLQVFYAGATQIEYEYFVHADDLRREPDEFELEDAVEFDGTEVYVPSPGLTTGIRAIKPSTTLPETLLIPHAIEAIAETQTNTLYNEDLWSRIDTAAPLKAPMLYMASRAQ